MVDEVSSDVYEQYRKPQTKKAFVHAQMRNIYTITVVK